MGTRKAPGRALMEELTVTVDDTAALLGLSRNGTYNAVRDGKLPSIRVGRAIRIPTSKLRALLGIERDGAEAGDVRPPQTQRSPSGPSDTT